MSDIRAGIIATGSAVPSKVVSNKALIRITGIKSSSKWIMEKTGIMERRYAQPHRATSYYGAEAAKKALEKAGIDAKQIDMILVATTTPDYQCPATAPIVGSLIGATGCPACDIGAGCAGFVYALHQATGLVMSGMHKCIVVIGADLLSTVTNYTDRGTCILFGDGAGAAIVGQVEYPYGIDEWYLGADGSQAKELYIPAGGSSKPLIVESILEFEHKLAMNGGSVYRFAVKALREIIEKLSVEADISYEQIDVVFPHQANKRIIVDAQKHFGDDLPLEKFYLNIERYGNTSAASIPIALDEWIRLTDDTRGRQLILAAFGAGLVYGGIRMRLGY